MNIKIANSKIEITKKVAKRLCLTTFSYLSSCDDSRYAVNENVKHFAGVLNAVAFGGVGGLECEHLPRVTYVFVHGLFGIVVQR